MFEQCEQELQEINTDQPFDHAQTLDKSIFILRSCAVQSAQYAGLSCSVFQDLPRGFRTWLSRQMKSPLANVEFYLRWMVRTENPDVGIWKISHLDCVFHWTNMFMI